MKAKKIIFILVVIGFVSFLASFLTGDFWTIEKIDCQVNEKPCSGEIWLEMMSLAGGKNLLFLSAKTLIKQIEEKPGIQKAEVKKKLPDQLIIKLQKKETKEDKIGQILKQLRLRLFQPEKATFISERAVEILFKDNLQVIFSLKKEIEVQLDSLQLISSRAKIEGKKIKRLDLRFDKPVVVYD